VFLERSPDDDNCADAAFMVLRLVDVLGVADQKSDQGFRYQTAATEQFCREQLGPGTETTHLHGIIESVGDAHRARNPALLAPAMLAYAYHLEEERALNAEALDVLTTLDRVAAGRLAPSDAIATALRTARVNRRLARFDAAMTAYELAAARADAVHDHHSVLLSRLGRANVFWLRGNLAEAERWNREVLQEATAVSDRDATARAHHGLGVVLTHEGQVQESVPHYWHAFEAYDDESLRLMALHDLGIALVKLGMVRSAERALRRVVEKSANQSGVQNAMVELMHCASYRRDHVGFKRWQSRCESEIDRMAPDIFVDYALKLGIGMARFGQFARAATQFDIALRAAQKHGIHEFEFRIERIRAGLHDCQLMAETEQTTIAESEHGAALGAVASALNALE
jgi:tetratricopeptide (TPR) repeat protein